MIPFSAVIDLSSAFEMNPFAPLGSYQSRLIYENANNTVDPMSPALRYYLSTLEFLNSQPSVPVTLNDVSVALPMSVIALTGDPPNISTYPSDAAGAVRVFIGDVEYGISVLASTVRGWDPSFNTFVTSIVDGTPLPFFGSLANPFASTEELWDISAAGGLPSGGFGNMARARECWNIAMQEYMLAIGLGPKGFRWSADCASILRLFPGDPRGWPVPTTQTSIVDYERMNLMNGGAPDTSSYPFDTAFHPPQSGVPTSVITSGVFNQFHVPYVPIAPFSGAGVGLRPIVTMRMSGYFGVLQGNLPSNSTPDAIPQIAF